MSLRERAWQTGANLAAALTRLVPHRARYPLALRLARMTAPVIGPTLMKRPQRYLFSTVIDETLRVFLRIMSRHRITFDPRPRLFVPENLSGALFVGAHFPLNALATRHLHDRGCRPIVLLGIPDDTYYVWGTTEPLDCMTKDPAILVKLRNRLRDGHAIIIVVDRDPADEEEGTQFVETQFGTIPIATTIFDFAKRMDIPIYWFCVRTEDDGVPALFIEPIEPSFEAYASKLREHAGRLRRF